MQPKSLDILLADVRTRSFNATQNVASVQQVGSNSLFSMMFDKTLQLNQNPADDFFSNSIQYNSMPMNPNTDLMDNFRKDLMATGIPMERFSISSQAKSDIQQIMTGQGYSETEVNGFLSNVFQDDTRDTVKVSDFMKMYSEKKPALEKDQAAPVVEASDVPMIEKGLKEYGLSANQLKVAIENSRTESGDLDVRKLARELSTITVPLTNDRPLSENTQAAISQILSKLGVEVSDKSVPLTFNRFVTVLKNVSISELSGRLSQEKLNGLFSNLMANIKQTTHRQDVLNIRQLYQSQLYQMPGFSLDFKDKPALENALKNMGISPENIQKIMTKILNGTDKINLANLIAALKKVEPELTKNLTAEYLFNKVQFEKIFANFDKALNPLQKTVDHRSEFQNILKKLGLSDEAVQKLLSSSTTSSGLIDMDKLIANLKQLMAKSEVRPKIDLSNEDLKSIQNLLTNLKGQEQINIKDFVSQLDKLNISEKLRDALTQLGLPKEKVQEIYLKVQSIQDSLSAQQLLSQITNLLQKAGIKTSDQNIKAELKNIEKLLSQIQLSNQTISQSDLNDLKNMLKQFGATSEMLDKVLTNVSNKSLTFAQFAENLKKILPQLPQNKKVPIPADGMVKNLLAGLTSKSNDPKIPKTLNAFVNELENISKNSVQNFASRTKQVVIPSEYMNDLKNILKELGFQSGKINEIIPKSTSSIPLQGLIAKLKPELSREGISTDKLKEGFTKLEKLLSFAQSKGKSANISAQLSSENQKAIASTLSKLAAAQTSQKEAIIPAKNLPLLERTLVSYGMSIQDAQKLIAQSKNEKGDVLLSKFSDALQTLTGSLTDNSQIKTLADHLDAYLALLEKRSMNENVDKRAKNSKHPIFQNMKNGKNFDAKEGSNKTAKLAETSQQARMSKVVSQSQANSAETISATNNADDNNSFIQFLKQESSTAQSAKLHSAPRTPDRPVPYYLNHQVSRQLASAMRNNENQVTFQLRPPHLGNLQLNLEIQNNVLKIGMATDNKVTKEILITHVSELKEALVEQGIKIDEVDIQINYDLGQSLAKEEKEVFDQRNGNKAGKDKNSQENPDALALEEEDQRPIIYGDSSLSLIV